MNENYIKELASKQKLKIENIQSNLDREYIFPNRKEPRKPLSLADENILKVIYSLKVATLTELSFLFAFVYSKSKMEEVIQELEQMNYIKSSLSKDFGKCICLTNISLSYLFGDSKGEAISFSEDNIPTSVSKLYFHKVQNGYIAKTIFHTMTENLFFIYKGESKEFRDTYCKEEYIKRCVYPAKNKKNKNYNKKEEREFVENYMPILNNSQEELEKYKNFIRTVKEHLSDDMVKFSFLKSYYNMINKDRDEAARQTYQLFSNLFNTIYRENFYTYRNFLYQHITNQNENLKKEHQLFTINNMIKTFTITKRNLTNSKKGKTEEELKTIIEKIETLEQNIEKFTKHKHTLEQDFETMIFDGFDEKEVPHFASAVITLDTIKNNSIHITDAVKDNLGKWTLTFSIFQTSLEEMAFTSLFKRLEMIHKIFNFFFLSCNIKINIVCLTNNEKELLETKLKSVVNTFATLTEYQMFMRILEEVSVVSTKQNFLERHEVFKNILS